MRIGVIGTSAKAHERRAPLHPDHLAGIPAAVRSRLVLERGYGGPFGWPDDRLLGSGIGGLAPRAELLAGCEAVILPKPVEADLRAMRTGAVLWGWPHAVQQPAIAQAAIDRRLTVVAFEHMHAWDAAGRRGDHVFRRNNELAGYCAVRHATALAGLDGHFGPAGAAVVLGAGACGSGALRGLRALGFADVTACYQGAPPAARVEGVRYLPVVRSGDGMALAEGGDLRGLLAGADVLVNAVLQDPLRPVVFAGLDDLPGFRPGALLIDVSCDVGMGFDFARPTTFAEPLIDVGPCRYYAVDHAPSYLWAAATWEISAALAPYLPTFAQGPAGWEACETLRRAVDVEAGVVRNPAILAFQGRQAAYPHVLRV